MTYATNRPSVEELTRGLTTKSDRIRALGKAGYTRVEISDALGLSYQHVRKVLVGAGMTGGLQREVAIEREAITVEVPDTTPAPVPATVLTNAGFHQVAAWRQIVGGSLRIDGEIPRDPGVYVFTLDDIIVYVGLTVNGLRARLEGYRYGYEGQRTNARVNKLIAAALSEGHRVEILVALPPAHDWNGLPVVTAAGLEAGLIEKIRPAWNIQGA